MSAYGTSRTARTAVLPYDGVMRHPLTEGHTGLPEMDCPLITSEHSSRLSREESHDFNRGRSQIEADVLKENRSMVFDYKYFDETGDNWKVIVPDSTKAVAIPMKALTFTSGSKATQFVKCFKMAVAKINVQFTAPVSEKYMLGWERCE